MHVARSPASYPQFVDNYAEPVTHERLHYPQVIHSFLPGRGATTAARIAGHILAVMPGRAPITTLEGPGRTAGSLDVNRVQCRGSAGGAARVVGVVVERLLQADGRIPLGSAD